MLSTCAPRGLCLALILASAAAATTPERVLVVVNGASTVSRKIGDYYLARRGVPDDNVCVIEAPAEETVERAVYAARVEAGVAACLRKGDARKRIDYIVTTKGVPLRISGAGGRGGDAAAVDSELALLYAKLAGKQPDLKGRLPNPLFRRFGEPFDKAKFPIYLVTRLTGYSFDDVRAIIDRSLEARNQGRFILDDSPVKNDMGGQWLRSASRILPPARVLLDRSNDVVYDEKYVIAYASWGSNDPQRLVDKRRFLGFDWLPGAIATEYVSTNGRTFEEPPADWTPAPWNDKAAFFKGAPQTLTADLLREGATGASGHVYEPYLDGTPQPQYVFPAYVQGRTLAESFYLGIPYLSWMNIVVGDPLCRLK